MSLQWGIHRWIHWMCSQHRLLHLLPPPPRMISHPLLLIPQQFPQFPDNLWPEFIIVTSQYVLQLYFPSRTHNFLKSSETHIMLCLFECVTSTPPSTWTHTHTGSGGKRCSFALSLACSYRRFNSKFSEREKEYMRFFPHVKYSRAHQNRAHFSNLLRPLQMSRHTLPTRPKV